MPRVVLSVLTFVIDSVFSFFVLDLVAKSVILVASYVTSMMNISQSKIDFNMAISIFFVFKLPHWLVTLAISLYYAARKYLEHSYRIFIRYFIAVGIIYLTYAGTVSSYINEEIITKHPYQYTLGSIVYVLSTLTGIVILHIWDKFWDER